LTEKTDSSGRKPTTLSQKQLRSFDHTVCETRISVFISFFDKW
jgi:hypothetical protein